MSEFLFDAYEAAENRGPNIRVVESDDWHLQLDHDAAKDGSFPAIADRLQLLDDDGLIEAGVYLMTTSPGGNRHIYLKLKKQKTEEERIMLQAMLGSDGKRELLSYLGTKHPRVVLFETEEEYVRVCAFLGRKYEPKPAVVEDDLDIPF